MSLEIERRCNGALRLCKYYMSPYYIVLSNRYLKDTEQNARRRTQHAQALTVAGCGARPFLLTQVLLHLDLWDGLAMGRSCLTPENGMQLTDRRDERFYAGACVTDNAQILQKELH